MASQYEKSFVDTFIQKNRRARILYELSSNGKRRDALSRFCHRSLDYIDQSKIAYSGNMAEVEELDALIKRYTNEKECYLISWNPNLDCRTLERKKAWREVMGMGMASIMVFSKLAVIITEQGQGASAKYVLVSEK